MIYLTKVVTRGYIVPDDEDNREYWTLKPAGAQPWFIRAAQDPAGLFRSGSKDTHSINDSSSQISFDGTGMRLNSRNGTDVEQMTISQTRSSAEKR
jgi:adenine/guanine/hypoxanthine permease